MTKEIGPDPESDPRNRETLEDELFVHDYIEEGIKVNWKEAKELFNRIKEIENG